MNTKKSNKANLEKKRFTFLNLGFVIATACSLIAFEYTTLKDNTIEYPDETVEIEGGFEIPQTAFDEEKPKEAPEVEKTNTQIDEEIKVIKDHDKKETKAVIEKEIEFDPDLYEGDEEWKKATGDGPETVPFAGLEVLPSLPECEGLKNSMEVETCIREQLTKNLEIDYPAHLRDSGVDGMVLLTFIIDENGNIVEVKADKSTNPQFSKAAVKGFKKNLPQFKPGAQNGKKVRVPFNLPIKFKVAH